LAHNLALTNGSGTAFFAASTVGEYLNLSELWYSLNVSFQQVFLAYFLPFFCGHSVFTHVWKQNSASE